MERRLSGRWERLEQGKARVLARVGGMDAGRREWRPGRDQWSAADVVEHLLRVEAEMRAALAKEPAPDRPRVVKPGFPLRWISLRVVMKTGSRVRAPVESILPTRQLPWHALLARWEEERRGWEEWLRASDPAILATPRFRHPYIGWMDVPHALTFAADHLEHHIGQLERIERSRRGRA